MVLKNVANYVRPECYFPRPSWPQTNSLCWSSYVVRLQYCFEVTFNIQLFSEFIPQSSHQIYSAANTKLVKEPSPASKVNTSFGRHLSSFYILSRFVKLNDQVTTKLKVVQILVEYLPNMLGVSNSESKILYEDIRYCKIFYLQFRPPIVSLAVWYGFIKT